MHYLNKNLIMLNYLTKLKYEKLSISINAETCSSNILQFDRIYLFVHFDLREGPWKVPKVLI